MAESLTVLPVDLISSMRVMNPKPFKNPTQRHADTAKEKLSAGPNPKEYQARRFRSLNIANTLSVIYERSNKASIKATKHIQAPIPEAGALTNKMGSIPRFNIASPFVNSAGTLLT
ncbi:hypothetical protein FRC04_010278 [Tulasnella sp. 424]|nr:hypothetical protein FRC04_010278 [Tulasnella sp. 424]